MKYPKINGYLQIVIEKMQMNRFIVLDEFGEPIRTFYLKSDAMLYLRNKKGCKLHEISLYELLGECLL